MDPSQPKLSLPDITSDSLGRIVYSPKKATWTHRPQKVKACYIAKKINDEDLFGDTFVSKPMATTLGLSQIKEEKGQDGIEEQEPTSSVDESYELGELEPQSPQMNLFKKDTLLSSKYKEHGKGPSYAPTGHLVKHSIIGSVEMFERYQRSLKKHMVKESVASSEKDSMSLPDKSPSRSFKTKLSLIDQSHNSSTRLGTQSGLISKKNNPTEKKKESKDIRITKEDLYMKIDQLRKTQSKFYEEEGEKYKCLTLGDQLHHSKEQRCLERYESVTNYWGGVIDQLNTKIRRNAGKSVMLRSDEYREKREEAEAFTLVQTDDEKYGTTLWYMTLRRNGPQDEIGTQRVLQDIPSGFNCPQIVRPPSSLEVIRRSSKFSSTRSTMTLPPVTTPRYLDRTKRDYVMEKTTLLQKELRKIKPAFMESVEDFLVLFLMGYFGFIILCRLRERTSLI